MKQVKSFLTECRAKNLSGSTILFYEENLGPDEKMPDEQELIFALKQQLEKTFIGLHDYTMMVIMLETGMRIGEPLHLKVDDVFLKELEIRFQKGKGKCCGAYSKNIFINDRSLRQKNRIKPLPLPAFSFVQRILAILVYR